MRDCYHNPCDRISHPHVDEEDFDFLARITQALVIFQQKKSQKISANVSFFSQIYSVAELSIYDGQSVLTSTCALQRNRDPEPPVPPPEPLTTTTTTTPVPPVPPSPPADQEEEENEVVPQKLFIMPEELGGGHLV